MHVQHHRWVHGRGSLQKSSQPGVRRWYHLLMSVDYVSVLCERAMLLFKLLYTTRAPPPRACAWACYHSGRDLHAILTVVTEARLGGVGLHSD